MLSETSQEPIISRVGAFIFGFCLGVIGVLLCLIYIHPDPFLVNCGCGAMSQMCGECIRGGNLSAPICGAFK